MFLLLALPLHAQQDMLKALQPDSLKPDTSKRFDPNITRFGDLQAEMENQLDDQLLRARILQLGMEKNEQDLKRLSDLLRKPQNVPMYKDSAYRALLRVRKFYEGTTRTTKDMHYSWLPFWRMLNAVYARYGEMSALQKTDAATRNFIVKHRELYGLLDNLRIRLQDLHAETEFLLTSKLN